jgi:FKBP-type peptidyl-prolyl cis-trans isomerase 2
MNKKILVLASYVFLLLLVGCGAPRLIDEKDIVTFEYTLSFTDGTPRYAGTETITIGQTTDPLYLALSTPLPGHQVNDELTGLLLPTESNLGTYDHNAIQKLTSIYLPTTETLPIIGDELFFNNIGTGRVTTTDQEEGITYYTIDFNPRESYEPLLYTLKIVNVEKK